MTGARCRCWPGADEPSRTVPEGRQSPVSFACTYLYFSSILRNGSAWRARGEAGASGVSPLHDVADAQ